MYNIRALLRISINTPAAPGTASAYGITQCYLPPARVSEIGMCRTLLHPSRETGTHLSTSEGWKAELAWAVWVNSLLNGITPRRDWDLNPRRQDDSITAFTTVLRRLQLRLLSVQPSRTPTFFFAITWHCLWRTVPVSDLSVTSNASNLLWDQHIQTQERLSNLSLSNIESDVLQELDFSAVIDTFSSVKNCEMYKEIIVACELWLLVCLLTLLRCCYKLK